MMSPLIEQASLLLRKDDSIIKEAEGRTERAHLIKNQNEYVNLVQI